MMQRLVKWRLAAGGVLLLAAATVAAYSYEPDVDGIDVVTGVVTTDHVIVGGQTSGRIERLLVRDGEVVTKGQLIAVIEADELRSEHSYYGSEVDSAAAQVDESSAAFRFEEQHAREEIERAEAAFAAIGLRRGALAAQERHATQSFERVQQLAMRGIATAQQVDDARMELDRSRAEMAANEKDIDAARAAASVARANAIQIDVRRGQLQANRDRLAAARAQRARAAVRLAYTEVRSPIDGIVDTRVAQAGEVITAGTPIVTLIDPDNLWVRVDVEETYVDRLRLGTEMTFLLPSGEGRTGTVVYRGIDADFATQRDVSRSKRDIKTFEIRLRVDNRERKLAVGQTALVRVPVM